MSFFDRVGGKGKRIPAHSTFLLTESGHAKVVDDFRGDPKGRVLVSLQTRGTSNIDEISRASGMSRRQVEKIVSALVLKGYIQTTSVGEE